MLIMESVMLWLFPRLSRMNCALAANSSTSLNNPIPQFPPTPQNPTTITPSTQRSPKPKKHISPSLVVVCVCLSLYRSLQSFYFQNFLRFLPVQIFSQNRNRAYCSCSSPASSPQTVVTIQNADRSQSTKGSKWVLTIRVHEVECDQAACVCCVDRGRRYEKSTTTTTRKTKERRRRCNKSFVSHTTPTARAPKEACVAHDPLSQFKVKPLVVSHYLFITTFFYKLIIKLQIIFSSLSFGHTLNSISMTFNIHAIFNNKC